MFAHFGVFKREPVHFGEHSYELGIVWHRLCCLGSSDFKWRKLPGSNHISHTSRVRASRVTEVSREGKACKDKGEPIGTAPDPLAGMAVDSVISLNSLYLAFLALDILVWWCHLLLIWSALVISESWQPLSETAQEPGTWHALSWQISFPTLFTPLLSSLLFLFCFLLSSVPYSLHFPTLFSYLLFITSLLSSPLDCLDNSTLFTPLLSSHPFSFTALLSSHRYCLHISTSWLLYFLHTPTFFTSLLSAHLDALDIFFFYKTHFWITSLPYRPCNGV